MNQPQFKIIEGGKSKKKSKGKTQQALDELQTLLVAASADGKIDKNEMRSIMGWRSQWRTVLRRAPIRPFDDWLQGAIADGVIDAQERQELLEWAEKFSNSIVLDEEDISVPTSEKKESVESYKTGDEYLAIPKSKRPSWRNDPATAKQIGFLLDLGASESECKGLTKGEASQRIDAFLEKRDERRYDSEADYHHPIRSVKPRRPMPLTQFDRSERDGKVIIIVVMVIAVLLIGLLALR